MTENKNPVAKKPLRQVGNVRELLVNDQARQQMDLVAAKHLSPERMMRVVANAIRTTPKLQQCEPMSFLGALMQCASLGLEPNTVLGHAYLIPFGKDVQLVIGYKGLIDLARRSGHITSISAHVHYEDDELWDYEEGTEAKLRHRPGPQQGKKLHAYAIAKFKDGGHAYIVLPWSHVLRIRDSSQGYKTAVKYGKTDNPWMAHEDAMAKKTAIRALAKYLPLSVEFMDAVTLDHDSGARGRYADYAKHPTEGLTIDGSVNGEAGADPEDEAGETEESEGETPPEEEEPKDQADEEDQPKEEKPKQQSRKKAPPKEEQKKEPPKEEDKPEEEQPKNVEIKELPADQRDFVNEVIGNIDDGAPIDAAFSYYGERIDALRKDHPEAYEAMMIDVRAYAKDRDEELPDGHK